MGFTQVQGTLTKNASPTTSNSVSLTNNPTTGNLVIVGVFLGTYAYSGTLSLADANSNSYSAVGPFSAPNVGQFWFFYLLSAPSNASKNLIVTASSAPVFLNAWAEEFSYTGGALNFISMWLGPAFTIAATTYSNLSVSANAGWLIYALAAGDNGLLNAPTAGATQGIWTGSGGGPDSTNGGNAEYLLGSSAGAVNSNFTDSLSGDTCGGVAVAFFVGTSHIQLETGTGNLQLENTSGDLKLE